MKKTANLILVIVMALMPLGTIGAQEADNRLEPCTTEDIPTLVDTLLPVLSALATANEFWPKEKLDWLELPVDDFVLLSLTYASINDMLTANAAAFPACADSTLLVSEYDALIKEMTLWATEMALSYTYQTDPDDIDDASSFKAHALFHMEQAGKIATAIAAHSANLSENELMPGIPACSEEELTGEYATFLTMMEISAPLTIAEINVAIGPTSSQLLQVDSFNMSLSDMPDKLPFPVPECAELKLQTIADYTELADLAIFGALAKLMVHLGEAGNTADAGTLATIVNARQDTIMTLFAKWSGQAEPAQPEG